MPISVSELEDYWKYRQNLKNGEIIMRYIETSEMPPWEAICLHLNWHIYRVNAGYFSRKDVGYVGVYRLVALEVDDAPTRPATIRRVCGEDRSGTLYIGEGGWLNQRLNQLRRSLRSEDTHGASRMWRDSAVLKSKFPLNKLRVAVLFTPVGMSGHIEQDLIRAYLNSFGDTPPLNCSY